MNEQFALILTELQKLNARVTNIEETMATKNDIVNMATKDDIDNVKLLMNNQRIIFDQLERHEIAIRNLNEQTSKILKVIRV